MYHTLFLKGEELAILGEMLHTQIADSNVELRHTENQEFKEITHERVQLEQLIADKIDMLMTGMDEIARPSTN